MSQISPLSTTRFPTIPNSHRLVRDDFFGGFEFPSPEDPKLEFDQAGALEDPIRSVIWLGWINGISGIEK
jgi:hypothetical protein